jgi:hypothetical protein
MKPLDEEMAHRQWHPHRKEQRLCRETSALAYALGVSVFSNPFEGRARIGHSVLWGDVSSSILLHDKARATKARDLGTLCTCKALTNQDASRAIDLDGNRNDSAAVLRPDAWLSVANLSAGEWAGHLKV